MVYRKNLVNRLPLTSSTIETRPCLDSRQTSSTGENYYPTEYDTVRPRCDAFDDRYYNMRAAPRISVYDVQSSSGVIDAIETLPHYEQYVDIGAKKNQYYQLWSRPTI